MVNARAKNNKESLGRHYGTQLEHYANDIETSQKLLGRLVSRGELVLFLGAGVSTASKLPNWERLVKRCEKAAGITPPAGKRTTEEFMEAMDAVAEEVGDADKFRELVRTNLYPKSFIAKGSYPDSILRQKLLIALGALVMPSGRGSINEVITLNFDDLLEWYLKLHGFTSQSVPNFPVYLRSDVDVTIYHPHGYLPLTGASTDWLVLSRQEFIDRIAQIDGRPWSELLVNTFMTKRLLAIGTSMSDLDMSVYVAKAQGGSKDGFPAGFVVAVGMKESKRKRLLNAGIVPIVLDSYDDIPTYLLGVCRHAAAQRR